MTTVILTAVQMVELGYGPPIPIVPPDAKISPHSKSLRLDQRGKVPGRNTPHGWIGIKNWRQILIRPATIDSYKGNVGLLLGDIVAIDIDVRDAVLSERLQSIVVNYFDKPPVMRVGEAPKCAFLCRRRGAEMSRLQLKFKLGEDKQLVELLATGQQIVVQGLHARTKEPYTYPYGLPRSSELPSLDIDQITAMFQEIKDYLATLNIEAKPFGSGKPSRREEINQHSLVGPIEAIAEAVKAIPNTEDDHSSRASWVEMGMAIKAATILDPVRGLEIFMEWSLRWPENDELKTIAVWDSARPPFSRGADWLYREAQKYGHSMAHLDFAPLEDEEAPAPPPDSPEGPQKPLEGNVAEYSHIWLTERFVEAYGDRLRWVYDKRLWFVWRDDSWVSGGNVLRPSIIRYCSAVAGVAFTRGATDREAKAEAKTLSSKTTIDAVAKLCEDMPGVQARVDDFDADSNLMGVPGGYVDLRTGESYPPDRDKMISLCTTIPPASGAAPLWEKFLLDSMGGNLRMISYLKRIAGYGLTGRTEEHVLFLLYGGGGNGKSTFLNTLAAIMGEYCRTAQMDTFTATQQPTHPVAVAALAGARMVQSQETRPGQRWDETLLKQLSGGDAVTARFLFGQPFTYLPFFKLFFSGNHQPRLTSVGDAMKRRFHIVPFTFKPPVVNKQLAQQLRDEYPAILAWAIEGAQEWYTTGLCPPPEVIAATEDYLAGEDDLGRWMEECCRKAEEGETLLGPAGPMYDNWSRWCLAEGAYQGSQVIFNKRMRDAGYRPRQSGIDAWFDGLDLNEANKPKEPS